MTLGRALRNAGDPAGAAEAMARWAVRGRARRPRAPQSPWVVRDPCAAPRGPPRRLPRLSPLPKQALDPASKDAREELAEVAALQQRRLALAVGLPGLRVVQETGGRQ
jgi:hypothetical protein